MVGRSSLTAALRIAASVLARCGARRAPERPVDLLRALRLRGVGSARGAGGEPLCRGRAGDRRSIRTPVLLLHGREDRSCRLVMGSGWPGTSPGYGAADRRRRTPDADRAPPRDGARLADRAARLSR